MINKELLAKMIRKGFVTQRKHPNAKLWIYNYTPETQYGQVWNEVTKITRGLILDKNFNVVSRPFPKFFNLEELHPEEIPNLTFEITEKMDGSLGIGYWLGNKFQIATRGSFESEQAIHANKILLEKYKNIESKLKRDRTYLFEIIYPENRIVVDYKGFDDLMLIAVIDNKTGLDLPLEDVGFPVVKKIDFVSSFHTLKNLNSKNKEGFVIKFKNSFRMKIKFEEYVRLHRIITGISNKTIWEYLRDGKDFKEILENVPDEFYSWVKNTKKELILDYKTIEIKCKSIYKEFATRKETALYFQKQKYPSVLFAMLDNKDYSQIIWKILKPKYAKPFRRDM